MKILMFLQGNVGGAEKMTVLFAKMLIKEGHDVKLCILNSTENEILNFVPNGIPIIYIKNVSLLSNIRALFFCIKREKPQQVFSSLMPLNQRLLLLSLLFPNIRFIIRNDNYLYTLPYYKRIILSFIYRLAKCIVAQTEEMKDELVTVAHLPSRKIHILHNPVDTEYIDKMKKQFNPYQGIDCQKFVAVGRFHKDKGYDILVKAFSIVHKKCPNSKLFILGHINSKDRFYKQVITEIHNLSLENDIKCVGFQNNPYPYMNGANCFVLSSRNEGLPNVLLEAQYLGIPSAATSCIPMIKRIVVDDVNGYLAAVDDADSLATAMLNAARLKSIKSTYQPASINDVLNVFK